MNNTKTYYTRNEQDNQTVFLPLYLYYTANIFCVNLFSFSLECQRKKKKSRQMNIYPNLAHSSLFFLILCQLFSRLFLSSLQKFLVLLVCRCMHSIILVCDLCYTFFILVAFIFGVLIWGNSSRYFVYRFNIDIRLLFW